MLLYMGFTVCIVILRSVTKSYFLTLGAEGYSSKIFDNSRVKLSYLIEC